MEREREMTENESSSFDYRSIREAACNAGAGATAGSVLMIFFFCFFLLIESRWWNFFFQGRLRRHSFVHWMWSKRGYRLLVYRKLQPRGREVTLFASECWQVDVTVHLMWWMMMMICDLCMHVWSRLPLEPMLIVC